MTKSPPAAFTTSAHWSPDGTWIAYDAPGINGLHDLFIVDPDSETTRNLTEDFVPGVCCARWSPDSQALLVAGTEGDDDKNVLLAVPVDGSGIRQVTTTQAFYTDYSWGPRLAVGRRRTDGRRGPSPATGAALRCAAMATRRSSRSYWLIGAIGTNRLVTRLHPVAYRWPAARGPHRQRSLGIRNVVAETIGRAPARAREIPLYAIEDGDRLDRRRLERRPGPRARLGRQPAQPPGLHGPRRAARASRSDAREAGGRRAGRGCGRSPLAATRATTTTQRWTEPPDPRHRPRARAGACRLMPAPLGKTPTKKMPNIQVFGMDDSSATRNTLRFFRERRIVVHYVDLRKKPIARGELQRFVERLGAAALLDDTSKPYREQGLAYLSMDASGTVSRLLADARLLKLPLVRYGELVTAGKAEETWKAWLAKPR